MATTIAADETAVTIYNNDLALVRQVRTIQLKKGVQIFSFEDVAARIDPTSVHFKALSHPQEVALLEQNFEYDLVGMSRLLQKYINQEVLVMVKQTGAVQGTLLSAVDNDVIIGLDGGQVRAIKAAAIESVVFPSLPGGLVTRPTLVWQLDSKVAGPVRSEISYLTSGIKWHAEYVAVVNEKDTQMDLAGWVSIENNCGASFENAKLKLVAGDVNRVKEESRGERLLKDVYMLASMAPFEEKEFFEYHLYTLQRPATLKDRQIKQMSLFEPQTTPVTKVYVYDGAFNDDKVQVRLEFKNSKDSGLGMPLPKGKVRVYKRDTDGSQEFIGEDMIDHTPKDETVRLKLGNAFDVVGEREVVKEQKVTSTSRQLTVAIKLRNHKKEPIEVVVVEHLWGDCKFIGSTPPIKEKTARRVDFLVSVPANGETRFEYTVLIQ
ncbi:MAG: DUF4139 domain-containing protein [candidate division KSB1 bacterium]|nr:DUF4139 domain-containing protein [candidate division KSB1 bacterium]